MESGSWTAQAGGINIPTEPMQSPVGTPLNGRIVQTGISLMMPDILYAAGWITTETVTSCTTYTMEPLDVCTKDGIRSQDSGITSMILLREQKVHWYRMLRFRQSLPINNLKEV